MRRRVGGGLLLVGGAGEGFLLPRGKRKGIGGGVMNSPRYGGDYRAGKEGDGRATASVSDGQG